MLVRQEWIVLALLLTAPTTAAAGNVVTDWDEKAVGILQPGTVRPPETAFRTMAVLHLAMFDAVNSIEPRYKPYKIRLPATADTSKEAAAAAAAGVVLVKLIPDAAADVQSALTSYLATIRTVTRRLTAYGSARRLRSTVWRRGKRMVRPRPTPTDRGPSRASISRPRLPSAGGSPACRP